MMLADSKAKETDAEVSWLLYTWHRYTVCSLFCYIHNSLRKI